MHIGADNAIKFVSLIEGLGYNAMKIFVRGELKLIHFFFFKYIFILI